MKDIRSMEKYLPVIALRGAILFPLVQGGFRLPRLAGEALLKEWESKGFYAIAVHSKGTHPENNETDHAKVGTLVKIDHHNLQSQGLDLQLEGLAKVQILEFSKNIPLMASFEFLEDKDDLDEQTRLVLQNSIQKASDEILEMIDGSGQIREVIKGFSHVDHLINFCLQHMPIDVKDKQEFLELTSQKARGLKVLELLSRQRESIKLQREMAEKISEGSGKTHRENIIREQMRVLKDELGEGKSKKGGKDYRQLIEDAGMPDEVKKISLEEVEKLEAQGPGNPETSVIRNYLDLLTALPWKDPASSEMDLVKAREILNQDHFGLEKIKDLIIQHLAVMKLKKDKKGFNLLLVGPPGVGKTSLGKSIARAMNRPFIRASLGGVRDDAEIRGHRRTYIGALPGRIIQSMKRSGSRNPVFLLDEIDKLSRNWGGDPSSALLEVLDPEQNNTFQDHYLEVPYDLSQVFFIATANSLENVPAPLLDRMEVIHLSGYTQKEKFHIALDHLIPKQLEEHGMTKDQLDISQDVLEKLIGEFTRESGVRELQRKVAALCRIYSEKVVNAKMEDLPIKVAADNLEDLLGRRAMTHEEAGKDNPPGVVTGLAWTPLGGDILFIESTSMPGSGKLTLTGQLGDVMKESAQIALSLIRSQLPLLTSHFPFKDTDIHVHVPSGAIPKDGPSAGIALLSALTSLVLGRKVDPHWAFSGEVTLRGAVTPVGGIKEKVIAAHQSGITNIVLCRKNEKDLKDVPEEVKSQLTFHFVDRVSEVLEKVFGVKGWDTVPTTGTSEVSGIPAPGE